LADVRSFRACARYNAPRTSPAGVAAITAITKLTGLCGQGCTP